MSELYKYNFLICKLIDAYYEQ